jgi:AraC-like DNA-binding protein
MSRKAANTVPIRSFADGVVGPRFGIRSERASDGNRLLHRHDYFEVIFFVSSCASQRIAIHEHPSRRGSIFFISPMTAHQVRFSESDSCYVIYFDLGFLRPDLSSGEELDLDLLNRAPELAAFAYQQQIDFTLSETDTECLLELCRRMESEASSSRLCSNEIVRSLLTQMLASVVQRHEADICRLMREQPPCGGTERHVRGVMKFIADNLLEKVSLADAAKAVCVSPNYLASLLKRETGSTFVELVTEKRMDIASELLAFSNMRVSQVAAAAGFADFDYFCRRFKQVVGCSPLEFRAKHSIATTR